jgi:glutamate/tyrosine decarboxylase-like PLP-dependent enzyme
VPTEPDGTMRAEELARVLERCGPRPIVCAQLGSINTGACDPLDQIIPMVHARDGWVHVDGAFGLWAAACPELAHLTSGVGGADSWATDFHKMGQTPFGCGAVFTAHPRDHVTVMSTRAAYTTAGLAAGEDRRRDGMDYALGMARTGNGVPAYAALRALGRVGVAEVVRRCHDNAVMLAKLLDGEADIVIPFEPKFNQVLIDCAPRPVDDATAQRAVADVCAAVRDGGETWLGGTVHKGRPMARYSVTNGGTTEYDIERTAAAIIAGTRAVTGHG